jgi:microcystin-dependent protein
MANYLKATDFAAKDALLSGDPNKIVKGTEINDEFDSLQTAVNSKANLSSPTFVGAPEAPTATFGVSTTQLATTAFVQAALQAVYPVGSIYVSTIVTNPGTTFGFGTWDAFGAGKVLVGQDTEDTAFDVLEETGGSKDATLVSHTHSITDPGHKHTLKGRNHAGDSGDLNEFGDTLSGENRTNNTAILTATTGITIDTAGSSATNANLQPYVVVKMWKRTA